ncbi:maleylpyruvate isomerase family mycothiol-dependent enzyme [Yinghuangia soli]|uniref:Maleylpyruvate isomerase family mycothiol-dependent enzyme n=1 Tax=Yinghuangia soli TaxID=2908204 RepID=A0AA41U1Z9_9ACTN|nr:maleylpyruvate isomerase family mycothiol-dependent enzyme [Yinghuangia soli]MCF2528077.1 maleylpyruvate isomerase family mycothiol-dependent enzyme [Yinghuangia soli]
MADHDEVWRAVDAQRAAIADLLDDLAPDEWDVPSLCSAWRVRDVAAHLTLAHMPAGRATLAVLRARGSFHRMIRDTAVRQARLPAEQFAPMLRAMVGSRRTAPLITPLEPLIDSLVHGQDIAIPLARDLPMPTAAAATAATRVWSAQWLFRPRRKLGPVRLVATDHTWAEGEGPTVEGPMSAILLLLAGRTPAALPRLTGPGLPTIESRAAAASRPAA